MGCRHDQKSREVLGRGYKGNWPLEKGREARTNLSKKSGKETADF